MTKKLLLKVFQIGFMLMTWIVIANSQEYNRPKDSQCHKYCFSDCANYQSKKESRGSWIWELNWSRSESEDEYGECVVAHVACSCRALISVKNPLVWLVGLVGLAVVIFLGYRLYKLKKSNTHNASVPVNGTQNSTISSSNMAGRNFGTFFATSPSSNLENTNCAYQQDIHGVEAPPEYGAPPSYFECYENSKSDKKTVVI